MKYNILVIIIGFITGLVSNRIVNDWYSSLIPIIVIMGILIFRYIYQKLK